MAKAKGGRVRFVEENYGDSELARRFGVTRYPAIFVDDVLVATPKDFGFYGTGEGEQSGRYAPWRENAENYEKFRLDLDRMVELVLAGGRESLRAERAGTGEERVAARALPEISLTTFDGAPLTNATLAGKPTLVEVWATWCPPCRGTLEWLGGVGRRYSGRLEIVTLAIDSDEADVRKIANELGAPLRWAMGNPELVRELGDVSAVPTLFLFGADGRLVSTWLGAPPDLHEQVESELAKLLTK